MGLKADTGTCQSRSGLVSDKQDASKGIFQSPNPRTDRGLSYMQSFSSGNEASGVGNGQKTASLFDVHILSNDNFDIITYLYSFYKSHMEGNLGENPSTDLSEKEDGNLTRLGTMGTYGQQQLFGGLVIAVLGIGLICMSGLNQWGSLANTGAALILIGTLLWLRGAVRHQNELIDAVPK